MESVSNEANGAFQIKFQNRINLAAARISNGKTVISFKSDIDSFEETFIETFVTIQSQQLTERQTQKSSLSFEKHFHKAFQTEEKNANPMPSRQKKTKYSRKYVYWQILESPGNL